MQRISNFCSPHMGFTEDVSLTFYSPLVTCPSSWHAMADRHSPVLPSTHVAHKITQREKQLQFQEFKRRQQIEKEEQRPDYIPYADFVDYSPNGIKPVHHPINVQNDFVPTYIKPEPPDLYGSTPCYQNPQVVAPPLNVKVPQMVDCQNHPYGPMPCNMMQPVPIMPVNPFYNQYQNQAFHFPPSPPNSPLKYQTVHQHGYFHPHVYRLYPHIQEDSKPQICQETHFSHSGCSSQFKGNTSSCHHNFPNRKRTARDNRCDDFYQPPTLKPKNIQVSLHCESPANNRGSRDISANHFEVTTSLSGQSCAVAKNFCPGDRIEYDIEASIHMKIVENPCRKSSTGKEDLDLPSIGSFLEYLND